MIDPRRTWRTVQSAIFEDGMYRVTFRECGHTGWYAASPCRVSYCETCLQQFVQHIRDDSQPVEELSPLVFIKVYRRQLAKLAHDAERLKKVAFEQEYRITPQDARKRLKDLRDAAAINASSHHEDAQRAMQLFLAIWEHQKKGGDSD